MPRAEARVFVSIWDDPEFVALPMDAQRYYLMVSSQSGTSHAGVVTIPRREWSNLSGDDDAADRNRLARKALEDGGFLVVDEDTDELLVRALLRRDSVKAPPGTFRGAMDAVIAVRSPVLRAALREELLRLDPDVIRAKRAATGESCLSAYRRALAAVGGSPDDPTRRDTDRDEPVQTTLADVVDNPADPVDDHDTRMASASDAPTMVHGPVVVDVVVDVDPSSPVVGQVGGSRTGPPARGRGRPREDPPPDRCPNHQDRPAAGACRPCGDARRDREQWNRDEAAARRTTRESCPHAGLHDDNGWLEDDQGRPAVRCDHHTHPKLQLSRARGAS